MGYIEKEYNNASNQKAIELRDQVI